MAFPVEAGGESQRPQSLSAHGDSATICCCWFGVEFRIIGRKSQAAPIARRTIISAATIGQKWFFEGAIG